MSAVLEKGLDVTALHNHFFFESPRMFYFHVHGHGAPADLAKRIGPALALIGKTAARPRAAQTSGKPIEGKLDVGRLAKIAGQEGEQTGAVYKITIGRPDIPLKEMGATINARMGLNTWAAFYGSDADAVVGAVSDVGAVRRPCGRECDTTVLRRHQHHRRAAHRGNNIQGAGANLGTHAQTLLSGLEHDTAAVG